MAECSLCGGTGKNGGFDCGLCQGTGAQQERSLHALLLKRLGICDESDLRLLGDTLCLLKDYECPKTL